MPLGNTQEAIPFKKDSLNHIPTHFVIRLDSKSILKPGPFGLLQPEVLLSQHSCTHESLQLLASRRHFLPGPPSLSLLTPLLKSWAGTRQSFDLDPEGDREESQAKSKSLLRDME